MTRQKPGCFSAVAAYPPFMEGAPRTPCLDDPDLFTDFGDSPKAKARRVAAAKVLCAGCPLREVCAEWATVTRQTGVWGGTDEFQRAMVRYRGDAEAARRAVYRAAYA